MRWKIILGFLFFVVTGLSADAETERYIVKFNDSAPSFYSDEETAGRNYCTATYDEVTEYLDMGIVEYYEPDYEVKLFDDYSVMSDETLPWNHSLINLQKAWDIGCYGNDIKVAIIDSGAYKHPDLINNLVEGYNYIDNSTDTTDNIGHGTFVSGLIAAESNDSYITGVAHQVKIVPLKCFDNYAETTVSMIADAIYDAVDVYDCDVINMSFGMTKSLTNKTLQLSVEHAIENGCIVVASVGNDGNAAEYYPAKYDNVIGVGSVNKNMKRSWFSQHNSTVDVVAPGEAVSSLFKDGFNQNSGTSFSAPHVAAVAAIAKCIDENLTAEQFMSLIENTSTECAADTNSGYDVYYGYGLINTEKIVDELLKDTPVFLSPVTNKTVKIYNNSDDNFEGKGLVSNYLDKGFLNAEIYDISLIPGEIWEMGFVPEGTSTKLMLWDGMDKLKPLYRAREVK